MRYLTERKRAEGKGASGSGTENHWHMQASAVALVFMVPAFLYVLGSALGGTRAEVLAVFARPFPAILTGLVLFVAMRHFARGAQMMIEDYSRGTTRKGLVIGAHSLAYAVTATGIFALAKIAL